MRANTSTLAVVAFTFVLVTLVLNLTHWAETYDDLRFVRSSEFRALEQRIETLEARVRQLEAQEKKR